MTQPAEALSLSRATLRPTTAEDLPVISQLTETVFGRRRSAEVLTWLLLADDPELGLQSQVAINNGKVVGHAAVLESRYQWGDRMAVGGHPMLWMLAPHARGLIAVKIGRWCTMHGDFSLVVGGTPKSKPIMDARKFVRSAATTEVRLATAVPAPAGNLELRPYSDEPPQKLGAEAPIVNLPSPARLRWLAACPRLESRLLSLYQDGVNMGPVLLYVNRRGEKPSGRIVHLPWTSGHWGAFVRLALRELKEMGCESASLLATHDDQLAATIALGGEPFYERLIFFRNQRGLPEPSAWHLSYLEGDLAYRRV